MSHLKKNTWSADPWITRWIVVIGMMRGGRPTAGVMLLHPDCFWMQDDSDWNPLMLSSVFLLIIILILFWFNKWRKAYFHIKCFTTALSYTIIKKVTNLWGVHVIMTHFYLFLNTHRNYLKMLEQTKNNVTGHTFLWIKFINPSYT